MQVSRGRQGLGSSQILVEAFAKQIFLVQQMTRILLDGPFPIRCEDQLLPAKFTNCFFQSGGSAPKSRQDVRIEINRKIEIESSVDPREHVHVIAT